MHDSASAFGCGRRLPYFAQTAWRPVRRPCVGHSGRSAPCSGLISSHDAPRTPDSTQHLCGPHLNQLGQQSTCRRRSLRRPGFVVGPRLLIIDELGYLPFGASANDMLRAKCRGSFISRTTSVPESTPQKTTRCLDDAARGSWKRWQTKSTSDALFG